MPEPVLNASAMRGEKRAVARNSVFAAIAITGLKFVVGISTGSLGILSEALHSSLDLVAAVITFFSIRVSDRPADQVHQYGHGKFENFSAFIETGLLLLTCVWIVWEAIKRLFFREVHVEASTWAFLVMFFSICMDWWRSRALGRVAKKYDSQALQADALHFSTDIWSSAVVILGLILITVGSRYDISWLGKADPVAALVVAGVVVYVSWRLARQTIDALLDAAPLDVRGRLLGEVLAVPGVLEVDRVRIRRAGSRYFADLSIALDRTVTFQRSGQVAREVTDAAQRVLPGADVMVNTVPRAASTENIFDRVRAVAMRHDLRVHDISVQNLAGRLHVEQHIELDETLPLRAAHDRVTDLESRIRSELPEISSILTHIESEPGTIEASERFQEDPALADRLRGAAAEFPDVLDTHDYVFRRVRDRLYLSCHCTMPDDLPLARVHDVQTGLEARFKQLLPQLARVLIHPEPQTDSRR